MAILGVTETFDDRGMSVNDLRERNYTRTFLVETDARTTDPNQIRLAPQIPRPWTPYLGANGAADLGSWCRGIQVKQDTVNPYLWRVTCSYSSRIERPDINLIENPLLRPSEISWTHDEVMRVAYRESEFPYSPIRNSAKERFDPPVEIPESRLKLVIARNQATFDATVYLKFINSTNEYDWFGFNRGRILCKSINAGRQFENGILFWRTTYEFLIRMQPDETGEDINDPETAKKAWFAKILDQGYHKLVDGKQVRITDPRGLYYASPVPLDGSGGRLADGGDPVFLEFRIYGEQDFRTLNLP